MQHNYTSQIRFTEDIAFSNYWHGNYFTVCTHWFTWVQPDKRIVSDGNNKSGLNVVN